jgi:Transposase DDE domain
VTKVYFFNLLCNSATALSEVQIKKILILAFGISQSKTVNLNTTNDTILISESGCKNSKSQYNWLLSLFQTGNYEQIVRASFQIVVLYFYGGEPNVKLIMDRTNWKLGKNEVNILAIGLLIDNNIFIPLVWKDLGCKGNSNTNTRLELIDQILGWWKNLEIPIPVFELCGDREFIGEGWLKALCDREICFIIRLKENLKFEFWSEKSHDLERTDLSKAYEEIVIHGKKCAEVVLQGTIIVQIFFVKNSKIDKENNLYLFFITNLENIEEAALFYRKRWKIEVFFKHLKSAGFHLEDFNMTGNHKTNILMAILSIVYIIVYQLDKQKKAGEKNLKEKTMQDKSGKTYPRVSNFRIGKTILAKIRTFETFCDLWDTITEFILLNFLFLKQLRINYLPTQ